jgi:hypothetical protein
VTFSHDGKRPDFTSAPLRAQAVREACALAHQTTSYSVLLEHLINALLRSKEAELLLMLELDRPRAHCASCTCHDAPPL